MKRMVSMPEELFSEIDRDAARRGESRSGWLQQASRERLRQTDADEIRRRVARIRARSDELGRDIGSAASIRAERDWLDQRDRTR